MLDSKGSYSQDNRIDKHQKDHQRDVDSCMRHRVTGQMREGVCCVRVPQQPPVSVSEGTGNQRFTYDET